MWNFRELCHFMWKKKRLKRFAAPHTSPVRCSTPGSTAQLPAPPTRPVNRLRISPPSPAMTQTLGRRDDELTPMAGATGTSALEANTKLGGWMNEPPSLKRTAFWHPENGGDSKFGSFKLPVFVFSWGELLVSGMVSSCGSANRWRSMQLFLLVSMVHPCCLWWLLLCWCWVVSDAHSGSPPSPCIAGNWKEPHPTNSV